MKMVVDGISSTHRGGNTIQPLIRLKDDVTLYSTEEVPQFDDSVWFAYDGTLEAHRNANPIWSDLEWDPTITF